MPRIGADPARDLEAVHLRKADVEERDVGREALDQREPAPPVSAVWHSNPAT